MSCMMLRDDADVLQCAKLLDDEMKNWCHFDGKKLVEKVCFCCDTLLFDSKQQRLMKFKTLTKNKKLFEVDRDEKLPDEVMNYCKCKGRTEKKLLKGLVVSPKTCVVDSEGILCCQDCGTNISHGRHPKFGIKNGLMIGTAPEVIEELTEVELRCTSLVRNSGCVSSFVAGPNDTIRGWHSMVDVDQVEMHRTLEGMNKLSGMHELSFPKIVAVVTAGPMTSAQALKVKKSSDVRVPKMVAALKWLIKNNIHCREMFKEGITEDMVVVPKVIDKSHEVESMNTNIELTEEINVVFPDNTLTETKGGHSTFDDFKAVIAELNETNLEVTLETKGSSCVHANKGGNFVKSFPKQFPFGMGSPKNKDFVECLIHVNKLSNKNFHTGSFTVISWNIIEKERLLRRAHFKVKSDTNLQQKVAEVTSEEMKSFIEDIQKGKVAKNWSRHGSGERMLLDTVEATCWSLPHGNEAAKHARKKAFSLQIEFGDPFLFFTVAPEDGGSFLVSLHAGLVIHKKEDFRSLTEEDLKERATRRHEFRLNCPGLGAMWCRPVMNAVWKNLIGWDWEGNKPVVEGVGLFRNPIAASESTEEQTRKMLHGHGLGWFKESQKLLEMLQSQKKEVVESAKKCLVEFNDTIASTEFMNDTTLPSEIIPHDPPCDLFSAENKVMVVDDQTLRDMRHRIGKNQLKGHIGRCMNCHRQCSLDDLALWCTDRNCQKLLSKSNGGGMQELSNWKEGKQLMQELVHTSLWGNVPDCEESRRIAVTGVKNLHAWKHVPQCFKRDDECRCHLPMLPQECTTIEEVGVFDEWHSWTGAVCKKKIFDVNIKRNKMDVFMNQYFKPISCSALGSNSNAQMCINGQKAMHVTKCPTKSTQEEDEAECGNVLKFTHSRLKDTRHETEFSESLSRLIGASLAHSSNNVISAWLAKHLILHGSRFRFSHEFRTVPVSQMQAELFGESRKGRQLKFWNNKVFTDSVSLQCLNRPSEMESVTLTEFVTDCLVEFKTKKNKKKVCASFNSNNDQCEIGKHLVMIRRTHPSLPAFNVWAVPDSRRFSSDLLTGLSVDESMEDYALEILVCFCPFRSLEDLSVGGSHVSKFRQWKKQKHCSVKVLARMKNIQDFKNNLRMKRKEDNLEKRTEMYKNDLPNNLKTEKNQKDVEVMNQKSLALLQQLEADSHSIKRRAENKERPLFVDVLRDKGSHKCGHRNLPNTHKVDSQGFLKTAKTEATPSGEQKDANDPLPSPVTKGILANVFIQKKTRKVGDDCLGTTAGGCDTIVAANGTPQSICNWGEAKFGTDKEQRRAFEVLTAQFVLRHIEEADENEEDSLLRTFKRQVYSNCKGVLKMLVGKPAKEPSLIMFLTGAGGSGKSEVIKQVLSYAKDFSILIGQRFTKQTILVTASSGVAATLIRGQTVHSACHLNCKLKNIDEDTVKRFSKGVRMVIVDEISMLKEDDFDDLNVMLNHLTENPSGVHGNLDIAFMGDFRQLPPVKAQPLYMSRGSPFQLQVNCFIELKGMYRFKEDPEYGALCQRFREGIPTLKDFDMINERLVTKKNPLPEEATRVGCANNKQREAINTGS